MNVLFAYGTLMCPDIMQAVAKQHYKSSKAMVTGYRRLKVRNQHYPGLIPLAGTSVEGRAYFNISPASWRQLDLFEGEMYSRQIIEIMLENSTVISAFTYIVRERYHTYLTTDDWDFDEFLKSGKKAFIHGYHGYNEIDE